MSVRTDGIHPASRIGIMILERSKRSRLRFVMKFPNKTQKTAQSPLTCSQPQARGNSRDIHPPPPPTAPAQYRPRHTLPPPTSPPPRPPSPPHTLPRRSPSPPL